MMQFLTVPQAMPDKRAAAERRGDFREIYERFEPARAAEQAARCEQCGIPFCQVHCPLHNNIPDWLRMTAEGRLEEAYELASATNNMPEICGRICPQDRLCEGNCVIEKGFEAVTIGAVEKHITEVAFDMGWVKPPRPRRERAELIGVIGAGPAGLAVAEQLRKKGYELHVYDRYDRVGGLLVYGIPNFKLEKEVVRRRAEVLIDGGIRFQLDCEIGRDVAFEELRARHDALFIGTGVYEARDIVVPGVGLANIVAALDYLTASNRKGLGDSVPAFDAGALRRRRQAGGRDRWRRYRDGLRAHRGAAGGDLGAVPLSARSGQHAGFDARGDARRGGGGRVHLAGGTRSLPRRRPGERRPGGTHAPRRAGRHRTAEAGAGGRFRASRSRPISSSRRSASTPRICRACSISPRCR